MIAKASASDYKDVPVPAEYIPQVYGLISELVAKSAEAAEEPQPALDAALIESMYRTSPAHHKMLNYLADHPDESVYSDKLAAEIGLSGGARSLAGKLGAFGRKANHRWDGRKPFVSEWDEAAGQARHMMPADVAAVIKGITGP